MWIEFLIVNVAITILIAKVYEWPLLWRSVAVFFAASSAGLAAIVIEDGRHE